MTDAFPLIERAGKVLVDWRQNERSRSMIAPYSLRATPWPLVSTPVSWDEIETAARSTDARFLLFPPGDVVVRIKELGDLFQGSLRRDGRLPELAWSLKPTTG